MLTVLMLSPFFLQYRSIEDLSILGGYSSRLDSCCIPPINRNLGSSPPRRTLKLRREIIMFLQLWLRVWQTMLLLLPRVFRLTRRVLFS